MSESTINTLNDWYTHVLTLLDKLDRAPGIVLAGLSCVVFGYVLKLTKKFPNNGIPVAVVLWSIVINVLLAPPRLTPDTVLAWRTRQVAIGLIVGFTAWMIHAKVLKKLEQKIPWLRDLLEPEENPPDL